MVARKPRFLTNPLYKVQIAGITSTLHTTDSPIHRVMRPGYWRQ